MIVYKSKQGCLPNLIVIGAMKSATTSLHSYLNQHPQVHMSKIKEVNFFLDQNWTKGRNWYRAHFSEQARIHGETSPNYSKKHLFQNVPSRMYSTLPNAKLVYILRDPVERILSHYVFNLLSGIENRDFKSAVINTSGNSYIETSKYCMQLQEFLVYYPLERIFIITAEELRTGSLQVMNRLSQFLGIDAFDNLVCEEQNRSSDKKQRNRLGRFLHGQAWGHCIKNVLPEFCVVALRKVTQSPSKIQKPILEYESKERLMAWLYNDTKKLRRLTGLKLKDWCI